MQAARSPGAEFGTPTTTRPPQSIGRSKLHGRVWMQKENRLQFLMRRTLKSHPKKGLEELSHLRKRSLTPGEARRLSGGRIIVTGFPRLSERFPGSMSEAP